MNFMGIDIAVPGSDTTVYTEIVVDGRGQPSVRKITQLYGRPGNMVFADGKPAVDLAKDKDGVWR